GGYSSTTAGGYKKPPSGLLTRVLASQGVSSNRTFGGLVIVNAQYDIIARAQEIGAGVSPGLMAISPNRGIVAAFDAGTNSVYGENTATETTIGRVALPGPTTSMAV